MQRDVQQNFRWEPLKKNAEWEIKYKGKDTLQAFGKWKKIIVLITCIYRHYTIFHKKIGLHYNKYRPAFSIPGFTKNILINTGRCRVGAQIWRIMILNCISSHLGIFVSKITKNTRFVIVYFVRVTGITNSKVRDLSCSSLSI